MDISQDDNARFALIHDLANAFARRLDIDELIPFALAQCREILAASGVSILLLDAESNELYFPYVAEHDPEAKRRMEGLRIPADRGVAGAVLNSGRSELIADARADARFYSGVDRKTGTETGSMLAAPLVSGEKRLGVIEAVRRSNQRRFTPEDMEFFEPLARSIAVALENAGRFGEVKASADQLRAEVGALRRELAREDRFSEIIGISPAMSEVFTLMEAAAASTISVLIEGETGSGKELVARAIHRTSARADRPFIAINCAAVPEGLLESELFGHRRGAFTGALEDQQGLFKAASGGCVFLDEIGEMPLQMQAKLLRVIQEGELTPVGDTRTQKVDVRVISATNRDLEAAIAARTFRKDLYYRLAAFTIRVPALGERREDIPLLAARLLEGAARRHRRRIPGFRPDTIELLCGAQWPGNVRQLQNEVERAVALARDGETIAPRHLSRELVATVRPGASSPEAATHESRAAAHVAAGAKTLPLEQARAAWEAGYLAEVLKRHNGNVSRAAIALGISRVTMQKKMKEYSLRE
jgi:transcriptional regulator with GAF, ATPase, and Fis domain